MLTEVQRGTGAFDARSYGGQVAIKMFEFDFSEIDKYNEGGEACNIGLFFNGRPHAAIVAPKDGYQFEYDPQNGVIKVYQVGEDTGDAVPGALAEVADETDLTSIGKVSILAWGVM